jgi:hypothetical protein
MIQAFNRQSFSDESRKRACYGDDIMAPGQPGAARVHHSPGALSLRASATKGPPIAQRRLRPSTNSELLSCSNGRKMAWPAAPRARLYRRSTVTCRVRMNPVTAQDLREQATAWLRREWPEAVIIPELGVAAWGGARLDLAAVTETELIGVEIKGDGDSTARLTLQGMLYSSVCTRMFLLPSKNLREKCLKAKPPGWLMARNGAGGWWQASKAQGRSGAGFGGDGKHLPTSAVRLVDLLWADEVKVAIDIHGVYAGQNLGREAQVAALAEELPLKVLRPTVYWLLNRRRWETARFGSKQILRPDASAS